MGDFLRGSSGLRPRDVSPAASAGQAEVLPAAGGAAFHDSSSEDEFPSLSPQPMRIDAQFMKFELGTSRRKALF